MGNGLQNSAVATASGQEEHLRLGKAVQDWNDTTARYLSQSLGLERILFSILPRMSEPVGQTGA